MSDMHLDNTLIFETSAGSIEADDILVRELRGVEALSTPYEFHITFEYAVDGGISPDGAGEILSSAAQIGFGPGGDYRVGGVVRQLELLRMEAQGQRTLYEAILVPRLWLTT